MYISERSNLIYVFYACSNVYLLIIDLNRGLSYNLKVLMGIVVGNGVRGKGI